MGQVSSIDMHELRKIFVSFQNFILYLHLLLSVVESSLSSVFLVALDLFVLWSYRYLRYWTIL